MFGKKENLNRQIIGFTKARKILFFTIKPKPIYREVGAAAPQKAAAPGTPAEAAAQKQNARVNAQIRAAATHQALDIALVEIGMKISSADYISQCRRKAAVAAVAAAILIGIMLFFISTFPPFELMLLSLVIGMGAYIAVYGALFSYPTNKSRAQGKDVEKDILFAARDMIVSMRSGLPLFNAMATVSVGYGAASKEFEKIIDRVQLGMPMEQAIDEVSSKSQSKTFKRLMLQASTSIRVGADVITAIQEVINDAAAERVIELRRYGQKLNAISMFYMLFGIIFPSMGLAVASILSTFISFIPVSNVTLIFAAIALVILQLIFLNLISASRPSFTT